MSNYDHWANRIGNVAGATSIPTSPEPDLGLAVDLGTVPMTPLQREAAMNALLTLADDQEERNRAREEALRQGEGGGGFLGTVKRGLDAVASADIPLASHNARAFSGSLEAAGTIAGGASRVVDALRGAARKQDELIFGEEYAARQEEVREKASEVIGGALDWVTEQTDDVLATPAHALNIAAADGWGSLARGSTWTSAWERASNSTAGQAWTEVGWTAITDMTADELASYYDTGFDEQGRPVDQAYRDVRENSVAYNLTSGALDFVKAWFADPLVIGGKALSVTRALRHGDFTALGESSAARIRQVVTAPSDEAVESLKVKPWDLAGQNALRLRTRMVELRDQVRRGEKDAVDLINSEFAFSDNPDAAGLFVDAARLRKRDPETLEQLEEFDDDAFWMTQGAIMGNHAALDRLTADDLTRPIADVINAQRDTIIPTLDDSIRRSEIEIEEHLTDPNLTGFQRQWRASTAQARMIDQIREGDLAKSQLGEYEAYERFLFSARNRVTSPLRAVPGTGVGAGQALQDAVTHVFRPSGANSVAEVRTSYPMAAFRRRPGVADLSRPGDTYEATARYFDSMLAYGKPSESDAELVQVARRDLLNRAASAANDMERRQVMGAVENLGVEVIARKHGIDATKARAIASQVRGARASLFRDTERRHAETKAYGEGTEITFKDGDQVRTVDLPITVTQLQNYYIATDLRALDHLLTRHGDAIKAFTGEVGEEFTRFLRAFHNLWKPSVLFRLGYPVRTVTDEALRIMALTGSFTHMLGQMPQAAAIGLANMVPRTANLARAPFRARAERHWRQRNDDFVKGDGTWANIDTARKGQIEKSTSGIQSFAQKRLSLRASGKADPRPPAIVSKLEKQLAANPDGFAFDVAAGRTVGAKSKVFDFGMDRAEVVESVDGVQLAEYAARNADRLSHVDGVMTVTKVPQGYRLSIGRKGAGWEKLRPIRQPALMRGVTAGGQQFGAPAEPGEGDIFEPLMSSEGFWQSMANSHEKNVSMLRYAAMRSGRSTFGEANHAQAWAGVINRQLLPDPLVRRILADGTDSAVSWLRSTPEGRELARRIPFRSANPVVWTDKLDQHINTYLTDDALKAKVANGEKVTPEELQFKIDNARDKVPAAVDEESVAWDTGQGVIARTWSKFVEKGYHVLGTLPTDTLIRQPFFRANYQAHLKGVVNTMEDGAVLTDDVRKLMERQAREFALRQTRRYLFSLADETDLTHTVRFFAPFAGAWQETMTRWGTILLEHPEAFGRIWANGVPPVDELWFVQMVDENGLSEDDPEHGELTHVRVPLPKGAFEALDHFLPGDQSAAADVFTHARIDKNALNTITSGAPWWLPSGGPVVQFPAKALLGNRPDLADENGFTKFAYKYLFPTGVPDNVDAILPAGWMQAMYRYFRGTDDPVFQTMSVNVYKADLARWEAEGRVGPKPTPRESREKAEAAQIFFAAARFGSPAAFTPEVEGQFFIDRARQIQAFESDPNKAMQTYLDEYGDDAWLWWASTSKSKTGVPPTSEGFKGQDEYADLITDFPELGLAIVGLDAGKGPFNYAVYEHQRKTGERISLTEAEAVAQAESEEGWRRWNLLSTQVDTELARRGLKNTQQRGAEDLAITKDFYADQLGAEFPGWGASYSEMDTNRTYDVLGSFIKAIDTGRAPDPRYRPDWAGVHEFLAINRGVGAALDARGLAGGSRNIEVDENADLAYAYAVAVGQLTLDNPMFADLYHRFFERHSLTQGSGGLWLS